MNAPRWSPSLPPPCPTWHGRIGILGLILAEISLFGVFVVAYLFYIGKSLKFRPA